MKYSPMQFEEAVEEVVRLRDEVLPDDDPAIWQGPLFGAIDALRPYLYLGTE